MRYSALRELWTVYTYSHLGTEAASIQHMLVTLAGKWPKMIISFQIINSMHHKLASHNSAKAIPLFFFKKITSCI
jgi:hypothetical protein